jgi:hypothetical protein
MTPLARRATTALTSVLLASAGLVATGVAPAQAAPVAVDDAVLYWDLNDESTSAGFAPGTWNLFSAGKLADPTEGNQTLRSADAGATWSNGKPAGWSGQAGNVTVEDLQTGGSYAVATFASTRTNTAGTNANAGGATPRVRGESRLAFAAGTGTLDPDAGNATIAWEGDATVVYYSGMSFFYLSDPELSLTGGDGAVTATLSGYGSDMTNPDVWTTLAPTEVTLATITDATVTATGVVATPAYRSVEITPPGGNTQVRTGENWGSFPQSFVDFQGQVGTAPYWYSSGGSADVRKVTNPLSVVIGAPPANAASSLAVTAPAKRFGQAAIVSVRVSSAGSTAGSVTLTGLGAARTVPVTNGTAVFPVGRPAARTYRVTATYSGTSGTLGSTAIGTLTVSKAASSTAVKVVKPTTRKAGQVTVTVASPTTTPAGKVRVVVKKGSRTVKTLTQALNARKATLPLPKGATGAYKAVVTYLGNANTATSARTASYKITK